MMKEHAIAAVRDRDIVIVDPVWINTHAGQCVIVRGQKLLQNIIIVKKPDFCQLQILSFPQGKFKIVIGTVERQ